MTPQQQEVFGRQWRALCREEGHEPKRPSNPRRSYQVNSLRTRVDRFVNAQPYPVTTRQIAHALNARMDQVHVAVCNLSASNRISVTKNSKPFQYAATREQTTSERLQDAIREGGE